MRTRIAITGATGFVGRHLVDRCRTAGIPMSIAIRDTQAVPTSWQGDPLIRIVLIRDTGDFGHLLEGCDGLIHLAGLTAVPKPLRQQAQAMLHEANVRLADVLVEAARHSTVRCIVNLSSIGVVTGNARAQPVTDADPPAPQNPYTASKRRGEEAVAAFASTGHPAISLRAPLIIGPGAKGNWHRLQQLVASGWWLPFAGVANRRSYLSVATLCEALLHLAKHPWSSELSGDYCIADPQPLSLPEVITALREGMGMPPRLFHLPPSAFAALQRLPPVSASAASLFGDLVVDGSRFERIFDFQPDLPIREAIRRSGEAFRTGSRG